MFSWCWPLKPRFRLRPFEATVGLRLKPPICRSPACTCRATATCPRARLAAPPQGNPDSGAAQRGASRHSDALDALPNILEGLPRRLDDGRPRTADLRMWLNTPLRRENRFRLIYDPSQAFWSAMHSDNAEVLEPLLAHTLKQISSGGHAIFATGPLPIHGSLFNRDRKMMHRLAEDAPEAADLFRLLGVDGDYNELDGPYFRSKWDNC
jgi:hypothetical protein